MNIILFTKRAGRPGCYRLGHRKVVVLFATMFALVPLSAALTGFHLGRTQTEQQLLASGWEDELMHNRAQIDAARRKAREDINALAVRLGQVQAQAVRLNALGQRLVESGHLDKGEFDFSQPPAQGGPEGDASLVRQMEVADFVKELGLLAAELADRERKFRIIESVHMSRNLLSETVPAGRPVDSGWVSSYFGPRTDPFTGVREHHKGVDVAGKAGSEIYAVAAGIVTWAGDRYGYGLMVEINHGNGYITRYAHNKENLVQVGDAVAKGQAVALMGSSGRSTGPHVHFEVLENGRNVDPARYIYAAR